MKINMRHWFCVLILPLPAYGASNYAPSHSSSEIQALSTIPIVDSGWTTETSTSDCASGWGDDVWNLKLTQPKDVTITVSDGFCPGDYFEVYVNENIIGTTQQPSSWGCSTSGSLSSGSFTTKLCPGTHTIKVRDAGFDGHSLSEIEDESMCPAGFTVSGTLNSPSSSGITVAETIPSKLVGQTIDIVAADRQGQQLNEVEPFVYLDKQGFQRLQTDAARHAGVSNEAISLAHVLIALNNRIIAAARADKALELSRTDFNFIEPFFMKQAMDATSTDPCGNRDNPASCPKRTESDKFFASEEEVKSHLESLGFHPTPRYASGGAFGKDYSRDVVHACGTSSFREQAIIHNNGGCWTYNLQGPEPNPEVLSYVWPRLNWVSYVRWWHLVFC